MRKVEFLAIVVIVVAVLILSWISFSPRWGKRKVPVEVALEPVTPATPEEEALPVRVTKVQARDFEDSLPTLGTVKGYLEIQLKFETSGVIKTLEAREGNRLKKGDLIATLEDKDAQLKLQYARKKLDSAQAQYLSAEKKKEIYAGLYKAGAIIKQKLEEASLEAEAYKSQVGMAEAEIEIAQAELDKTRLLSPKDGIIGTKDAEAGEFVTPQNKIISLFDLEKVYVELGIVEKDIEKIKLGQRAEIQLDSYPRENFAGSIDNLLPVIEGRSRTLTAKVLLDNPKGLLLPGMFSRAKIYLTEIKNAIMVPRASILTITPEETVVPVVDPGADKFEDVERGAALGIMQLRRVTTGYATTDYIQIVTGIVPGELVIIESKGELKAGTKVKVVGVEEPII